MIRFLRSHLKQEKMYCFLRNGRKLDKLTELLIKRPKLTLKVHGGWASEQDERALKVQKLIRAVMGQNVKEEISSTDALSLELLETTAKKSMESKELKALRNAMEEKYKQEAEFTHHYTAALVEKLIALQVLAQPELGVTGIQTLPCSCRVFA